MCESCKDAANEEEDDLDYYDHSVGEVDIVQTFQKKMRAISMKTLYNGRSLDRIEEGIETYSREIGNKMAAMEAALGKLQEATEQILAAQKDINGNIKTGQINKPTVNQNEVTTQINWDPNDTPQTPKIQRTQENCENQESNENTGEEDENKTIGNMGFRNEAAQ